MVDTVSLSRSTLCAASFAHSADLFALLRSRQTLLLNEMQFLSHSILLLIYVASYSTVRAMRWTNPKGWGSGQPPVSFKDKRLMIHQEATVYAWPSTGGRFELKNPGTFELDFLGIEGHVIDSNSSTDYAEEDAFVTKIRSLGGIFYPYQFRSRRWRSHLDGEEDTFTWLGWPEDDAHRGGVWMLKVKQTAMRANKTGRIRLARNMEERCRAIELCGGVFYPIPTDEHIVAMEPSPKLNRSEAEASYKCMEERERKDFEDEWGPQVLNPLQMMTAMAAGNVP